MGIEQPVKGERLLNMSCTMLWVMPWTHDAVKKVFDGEVPLTREIVSLSESQFESRLYTKARLGPYEVKRVMDDLERAFLLHEIEFGMSLPPIFPYGYQHK